LALNVGSTLGLNLGLNLNLGLGSTLSFRPRLVDEEILEDQVALA
jgi:hypothetical protein